LHCLPITLNDEHGQPWQDRLEASVVTALLVVLLLAMVAVTLDWEWGGTGDNEPAPAACNQMGRMEC